MHVSFLRDFFSFGYYFVVSVPKMAIVKHCGKYFDFKKRVGIASGLENRVRP
jgi:hypothetical protein